MFLSNLVSRSTFDFLHLRDDQTVFPRLFSLFSHVFSSRFFLVSSGTFLVSSSCGMRCDSMRAQAEVSLSPSKSRWRFRLPEVGRSWTRDDKPIMLNAWSQHERAKSDSLSENQFTVSSRNVWHEPRLQFTNTSVQSFQCFVRRSTP